MTTINRIARAIGRCPACKTVYVDEHAQWRLGGETIRFCYATPTCGGRRYTLRAVIGSTSDTTCGARCTNAVGPACDCACGGENHGVGHSPQPKETA